MLIVQALADAATSAAQQIRRTGSHPTTSSMSWVFAGRNDEESGV
ncbi:hypothetical protein SAMN05660874_01827 [Saccharopolyspora flava]|uniref:Uncharacterized protein n=1 Tax=Saccharopolyspora flava TaxID=95161 RepID=A0A1I6QSX9_9PSEU|nr:hypothetical protein SAMN05660874_01827 [Saccharopolyspora flava]